MAEPITKADGEAPARQRLHYLDNAKGLASLLGIFYHASLVYSFSWWRISCPPEHRIPMMGYCFLFLTYFRMPVFLFVAGYFTAYGLKKYGSFGFLHHRSRRIGLPLLTSLIVLLPMQVFIGCLFAHPGNWRVVFLDRVNPLSTSFDFAHLWFLYFVLIYSALVLVASRLALRLPLTDMVSHVRGLVFALHRNPWGVVACWVPINMACALVFYAINQSLHPSHQAWLPLLNLGSLLPIFVFGMCCQARAARLCGWLECGTGHYLMMLAILVVFHVMNYELIARLGLTSFKIGLFFTILFKWVGTVAVLGLIRKAFDYQNPVMRYMSDASYPVYLFHQPVIILIAFFLVSSLPGINPYLGYTILCLLSILLTYGTNELVVRRWRLGRFLFTGARQ